MPSTVTESFLHKVSLTASERWREGHAFECEARTSSPPVRLLTQERQNPSSGQLSNKPVGLDLSFSPLPEASRNVEVMAVEYSDYWDIKIMVAYSRLVAAGQPKEVERYANDIVVLLKCLAQQRTFSTKHENALALFLGIQNGRIKQAARDALRRLYAKQIRAASQANLEWLDDGCVICRFQHPQKGYGSVEREFPLEDLQSRLLDETSGPLATPLEEGDSFTLEMELDEAGRVVAYLPVRGSLQKRESTSAIEPELCLPDNIEDKEAMLAYDLTRRARTEARINAAQTMRQGAT